MALTDPTVFGQFIIMSPQIFRQAEYNKHYARETGAGQGKYNVLGILGTAAFYPAYKRT